MPQFVSTLTGHRQVEMAKSCFDSVSSMNDFLMIKLGMLNFIN